MREFNIITTAILFLSLPFLCKCNEKSSIKNKKKSDKKDRQVVYRQKNPPDTILLVCMNFQESNLLPAVINKIESFYHLPVKQIQAPLPTFAYFQERNRYKADSLLNYLADVNNSHYRFVAGLTSNDISTTNGSIPDWGIFGLGSLTAKGCITSSFRLKRNASKSLLTERLQKVILHEIGHNYGLEHCTSPYPCFMKAANGKISEVDSEPMDICKVCHQKIHL